MIRGLAWEVLRSGSGAPTRMIAQVARDAELDDRDRGLLARIVRTEVQRRGTLQALVHTFANGKPNRDLSAFLRLGFAQLYFMDRVPKHAAVSETVGAASEHLGLSKGKYVNGVLRGALRSSLEEHSGDPRRDFIDRNWTFDRDIFHDPKDHPFLWAEEALSLPAPLFKAWVKRFGESRATKLAKECLQDPRLSLRVVRGERNALREELLAHGVPTSCGEHPRILTADSSDLDKALASQAFSEGRLTVQGEAALRAAELCEAKDGERWLDLCAAPGGKTAVLAATGAEVVACDIGPEKLERLSETIERLAVSESVRTQLIGEDQPKLEESFDGVLLDVPCSNTGVLARRPDARWRYGPQSRKTLAILQRELLEQGAERVRPGGALVYSTCSIEADENQARIKRFVEDHPGWVLEVDHLVFPQPTCESGSIDGGFAARLRRH